MPESRYHAIAWLLEKVVIGSSILGGGLEGWLAGDHIVARCVWGSVRTDVP